MKLKFIAAPKSKQKGRIKTYEGLVRDNQKLKKFICDHLSSEDIITAEKILRIKLK